MKYKIRFLCIHSSRYLITHFITWIQIDWNILWNWISNQIKFDLQARLRAWDAGDSMWVLDLIFLVSDDNDLHFILSTDSYMIMFQSTLIREKSIFRVLLLAFHPVENIRVGIPRLKLGRDGIRGFLKINFKVRNW